MALIKLADVSHNDSDFDRDPEVLESLWKMEETHFWHAARNRWILEALRKSGILAPSKILEVGCGSGTVVRALQKAGYDVTGIDTADIQIAKADKRCPAATFIHGQVENLPAPHQGPYQAVCFLDVLEHLDDPIKLLGNARKWLSPNGVVIVTVPAHQSLYSAIDFLGGHKKRYEPGELSSLLSECGLMNVQEYGIFRVLLPVLKVTREKLQNTDYRGISASEKKRMLMEFNSLPPKILNRVFLHLCRIEQYFTFNWFQGKSGGSLLAVARKPCEEKW